MVTNSILRLPGGLICASASLSPATQLDPKKAQGPVSSVTKPIFTGSCAWAALPSSATAKPAIQAPDLFVFIQSSRLSLYIVVISCLLAGSSRRASLIRAEQPGLDQCQANAFDLLGGKLDQRRAHHRARQLAEQHQRFLHAVVHVDGRIGVEHTCGRVD